MDTKTDIATVTQLDVKQAEAIYNDLYEATTALERLNATYETYGVWFNCKPTLSDKAVVPNDLLKRSA